MCLGSLVVYLVFSVRILLVSVDLLGDGRAVACEAHDRTRVAFDDASNLIDFSLRGVHHVIVDVSLVLESYARFDWQNKLIKKENQTLLKLILCG